MVHAVLSRTEGSEGENELVSVLFHGIGKSPACHQVRMGRQFGNMGSPVLHSFPAVENLTNGRFVRLPGVNEDQHVVAGGEIEASVKALLETI